MSKHCSDLMFTVIDKNNDDFLSHSELKTYLKKEDWAQDWVKEEDFHWSDLFAAYDGNKDGLIDRGEFGKMYVEKIQMIGSRKGFKEATEEP